ncbi:hypothetical protein O6H91_08G077000 [Diphasiastrum complanatum]|uniref:Uncharacterized protein n=2 Tax=Diphasiastrum complanatum TaxID=34168 RepID=A0ACC2CYZ9_DIPCM|nr:hypothetical protein O6H91_08G076400 [Diphasiastrum complanatum]KAJ7547248.1 hypothetical protein O6H91_08G077000 [Diphasiastrum complanatum]
MRISEAIYSLDNLQGTFLAGNSERPTMLSQQGIDCTVPDDYSSLIAKEEPWQGQQECSMCGDVGISSELIQCTKCLHRLQHKYCSRAYPNIALDEWMCDWCNNNVAYMEDFTQNSKRNATMEINTTKTHYKDAFELLLEVAQQTSERECPDPKPVAKQGRGSKDNDSCARFLQVPKRQRCTLTLKNKPMMEKWKPLDKNKLHPTSSAKGIGRRYKLLSDVLC